MMNINRWKNAWTYLGITKDMDKEFFDLDAMYAEHHRYYHTGTHIKDCLKKLDSVWNDLLDPGLVEIAL